jgi:hypothetical protein
MLNELDSLKDEILLADDVGDEPFLAVSEKFEGIECRGSVKEWLLASVLEQKASQMHFSAYYTGDASLGYLKWINNLGYCKDEMDRRIGLIYRRNSAP